MRTAIIILFCGFITCAAADDYYWINAGGGDFHDADNWAIGSPAGETGVGVPGPADIVYFELNAAYEVSFSAGATNFRTIIGGGDVAFDLGGYTWQASEVDAEYLQVRDADAYFQNGVLLSHRPSGGHGGAQWVIGEGMTYTTLGDWGSTVVFGRENSVFRVEAGAEMTWAHTLYVHSTDQVAEYHVTGPDTVMNAGWIRFRTGLYTLRVDDQATVNMGHLTSDSSNSDHTVVVDNATLNMTSGTTYIGHYAKTDMTVMNNGVYSNSGLIVHIGRYSNAEGIVTVESGGQFIKTTSSVGFGFNGGTSTLVVRDPGSAVRVESADNSGLWIGYQDGANVTISVHTGGLMRVENDIWQREDADSTADIEVSGTAGPAYEERARIEAGNLFVGADNDAETTGTGSLTVSDGGRVEVAADIHKDGTGGELVIGSLSMLAVDGGAIAAESMMLRVENGDRAGLTVALHKGGTGALIDASGEATIDGADFELALADGFESEQYERFTVIAAGTLTGRFNGIEENDVIAVGDYYQFRASYEDDSFTLTTMPPPGTILTIF